MHLEDNGSSRRDVAILVLLLGGLFFFVLGRAPLTNPDEGRYAEIPREMVASGDWVTPRLNGVAYFEKPPLVYWLEAATLKVFGPREWALRLTPALFSLGGVLLTYATARRIFGRSAGLSAAVVLGTCLFYFAIGRLLLLDTVVSVLISATLCCFILGVREPAGTRRRWFFYGMYASAALATLAKGLIGFLLPGAVMFTWLLLLGQWKRLRPLHLFSGLALFLVIVVPWHWLAAQRNPTWAHFYFVHEHWERYTTTTHGRSRPWWFFAPLVIAGLFPWTAFLPGAIRETLAGGWQRRGEKAEAWFFAIWAAFVFLFFSASQSKLPPYVLPVFPPLAVLIGIWAGRGISQNTLCGGRRDLTAFALSCVVLAAALVFCVEWPATVRLNPGDAAALRPFAFAMAVVISGGGVATWWFARRAPLYRALLGVSGTAALFLGTLAWSAGEFPLNSTRELARYVKETVPPGTPIYHYHDFFHDFAFYAERQVGTVEFHGDELELLNDETARTCGRFIDEEEFRRRWFGHERVYVVVREKKLNEIRSDFAHAHSRFRSVAGSPAGDHPPAPVLADPTCHVHRILFSNGYWLLSNQRPRGHHH